MILNLLKLAILIIGISLAYTVEADSSRCSEAIQALLKKENSTRLGPRVYSRFDGVASDRDIRHLKVATMNTNEQFKQIKRAKVHKKNRRHLIKMSDFIQEQDIINLQEVDSFESLEFFNRMYLNNSYRILFIQGNDSNQSHMAFLIRGDLPIDIELQSHKFYKKYYKEMVTPIFSRDMPLLLFRKAGSTRKDRPFMAFAGIHYKSRGHTKGDDFSMDKRGLQVEATSEILDQEVYKKHGHLPTVMFGDFNNDVTSKEFNILRKKGYLDTLDLSAFPSHRRITHNYFSSDGSPVDRKQMDAVMINDPSLIEVRESEVYYFKDHRGNDEPLPNSYDERNMLPSDHNPVWAEIFVNIEI